MFRRGPVIHVAFWTAYFAIVWSRAFTYDPFNNLLAGHVGLWGDGAVHFTMGSAMAYRELILDTSPLLWQAPFRYPFLVNLISAILIRLGVPFFAAFTIPSFLFCVLMVVGLFHFFRVVFQSDKVAILSSYVFLLNGGLGFLWFVRDVVMYPDHLRTLFFPSQIYTRIDKLNIHWISIIDSTIIPQRAFQLGLPVGIACLVLVVLWMQRKSRDYVMVIAGALWGSMPLVHMHSFVAVSVILGSWCVGDILTRRNKEVWKAWLAFFGLGFALALPVCIRFKFIGSGVEDLIQWYPGWYADNFIEWCKFWILNWGITPVVAIVGLLWWSRRQPMRQQRVRLFFFILPFVVLFAVLNLVLLQPWIWDNSKLLVWVSLCVAGLAGYAISLIKRKAIAVSLFILMIISGTVDAYRILIPRLNTYQMYSAEDLFLVDWIKSNTDPQSVWLTGTYHNNWLFNLTGRRVLMTYPGWLWTHGYDYQEIEWDLEGMYTQPEQREVFDKYGVDFIVIGPVEKSKWRIDTKKFDFFFKPVKKTENYVIYSTGRSALKRHDRQLDPALPLPPQKTLDEAAGLTSGLIQRSVPNIYFSGPSKKSITAGIGFDYSKEEQKPLPSPFSLEIEGYLKVTEKGAFIFSLGSDDGSWLYLDDALVIDNGGIHATKEVSRDVLMLKGLHKIKIRYFDASGGACLKLSWQTPSGVNQAVPNEALFH